MKVLLLLFFLCFFVVFISGIFLIVGLYFVIVNGWFLYKWRDFNVFLFLYFVNNVVKLGLDLIDIDVWYNGYFIVVINWGLLVNKGIVFDGVVYGDIW